MQEYDFGEAKNLDNFRGRGVLKHVFDLMLKISARLYAIFYMISIYHIKQPIHSIFVIILADKF